MFTPDQLDQLTKIGHGHLNGSIGDTAPWDSVMGDYEWPELIDWMDGDAVEGEGIWWAPLAVKDGRVTCDEHSPTHLFVIELYTDGPYTWAMFDSDVSAVMNRASDALKGIYDSNLGEG